jgi:hypothetical protein
MKSFFIISLKKTTSWQATLPSSWSFLIRHHKVCAFFQTQIGVWLKKSLKHNEQINLQNQKEKTLFCFKEI